jgi:hypothetical protein
MQLSEGGGQWAMDNGQLTNEEVYRHVSICAPYLEVVEEMTLKEFLEFHDHFKPFLSSLPVEKIISTLACRRRSINRSAIIQVV